MKNLLSFIAILITIPVLSSCQNGIEVFGTKVEVVQSRNPDGTIKAYKTILNSAGEAPDAHALILHYPSGSIGVSTWFGNEAMASQAPQLKRR